MVIKSEGLATRTLAALGIVSLVFLAGCGGGSTSVGNQPPPPPTIPTITTLSPNTTVAGGAAFTLTINGTNFVAASKVHFGASAPATTFVSSTQLTAAIPASSIASTGTAVVSVTNPSPGGGTSSGALNFTITSNTSSPDDRDSVSKLQSRGGTLLSVARNWAFSTGNFCGRFSRSVEWQRPADHE